jgi:hypothetical protein
LGNEANPRLRFGKFDDQQASWLLCERGLLFCALAASHLERGALGGVWAGEHAWSASRFVDGLGRLDVEVLSGIVSPRWKKCMPLRTRLLGSTSLLVTSVCVSAWAQTALRTSQTAEGAETAGKRATSSILDRTIILLLNPVRATWVD